MSTDNPSFQAPFAHVVEHPDLPLAHRVRFPRVTTGHRPPALILLHGVGGNELNLAELGFEQDDQLLVILARGPLELSPGQFAWFHTQLTGDVPRINADEAEHARQLLIQFINALPLAYGIDPRQIYIAGFSQGGIMSASVALTRPDKIAGFGLLSGRILPEIAPLLADRDTLARLPAFVAHGQEDPVLPVVFARDSQHMLSSRSVQLTYREYHAGHGLSTTMAHDFTDWLRTQIRVRQQGVG